MTDLNTLLTQALALVSEDKRGQLADVMEAMTEASAQAAQRVGDAIAKHELKLSRARPDVVTGQKGAPRQRKGS